MASTTKPKIGTTSRVAVGDLHVFHKNARRGDVDLIKSSLRAHGQYKPVVANIGTHTGRPNEVLAGNHTLKAIRSLVEDGTPGWDGVLVHWVDVDEDMATRIVLADNRTAEKGSYDHEMLFDLVDGLGGDLDGTGFIHDDLDTLAELAGRVTDDIPDSADAVTPGDDDYNAQFAVTIVCSDERQQEEVFEQVKDAGLGIDVKVVTV